ncbi:MAG: hypothetical protein ABFS39_00945, partial [Pseudomonadota bacterium]
APSADLALSASTDPVVANETFTFNVDVGNISSGTLPAQLSTSLPAGVTVNVISDGGTEVTPGEIVWDLGGLGVSTSVHREITVTADADVTPGQILQVVAQLTHDGGLAVDNTAEHVVTVVSSELPLKVDISTSANPVVADEHVLYTLTVSNTSLVPVDDVSVILRVPAELSFLFVQDAEPNVTAGCGTTCSPGNEASWSLGTLAAGESRTITVNALVASVLSGNLITTPVRVTATGLGDIIDLQNTVAVYNAPSADLALSASTDPVVANETFTFNVDVGNISSVTLPAQLSTSLPAGVSVVTISDGGAEVSPGEVVWDLGSLGVGASVHREVMVTADGVAAGDILKMRTELTHDGGLEIDNRSEFAVSVAESGGIASLLSVDITATPDPVVSGGVLTYTITVTNDFALPVEAVGVMFRVPSELSFHSTLDVEPDPSGCSTSCTSGHEATWSLGTLAAGASQIITIDATVAAGLDSGNLISVPIRVTATGMEDTINLQHTTVIQN